MSIVASFNAEIERELTGDPTSPWFDDQFGASGQCDEIPPCANPTSTDPNPGRFALDEEEPDLNTLASMDFEERRLAKLLPPGATIRLSKEVSVFRCDDGGMLRGVQWTVSIAIGGIRGLCDADVQTTTLREVADGALADLRAKLDGALADLRAKLLDNAAGLLSDAERVALVA